MDDKSTSTTDALLDDRFEVGTLDRFERNRYFNGKLMTARDMRAEQHYHARRLHALSRGITGEGVVEGLDVSVSGGEDALVVEIDEGIALDRFGRPVVVPSDRRVTIDDDPEVLNADRVSVYLEWDECVRESVPISGAETACEAECTYNRFLEVYDVQIVDADEDDRYRKVVPVVEFPTKDELSTVEGREAPAVDDPGLAAIAETYEAVEEERRDEAVFVGTFVDADSDTDEWSRDESDPQSRTYSNDLLYAAIARHAADFQNPHQVTLTTETAGEETGVAISVADDESETPAVTVQSDDGSVEVDHVGVQTVDFSIESRLDALVEGTISDVIDERATSIAEEHVETLAEELPDMIDDKAGRLAAERVEPLERYAVEQALKYTGLVFRRAANQFDSSTAMYVSTLARAAADDRLGRETDAEAAEERRLRIVSDGQPTLTIYDEDVYPEMLRDFLDEEREFAGEVESRVTEKSHERLVVALDRLEATLNVDEPSTLRIGAAQDDVCDAVEWLEPAAIQDEETADSDDEIDENDDQDGEITPETATVPGVEGRPESDAAVELSDRQLEYEAEYRPVKSTQQLRTFEYGDVIAQSPEANTEVEVGTAVQIAVLVSAPLDVLEGLTDQPKARIADAGIDWIHELVFVDADELASEIQLSPASIAEWQAEAERHLLAMEVQLRDDVSLEEAFTVVAAFEGMDTGTVATMDDVEVQHHIVDAVDSGTVDLSDAKKFADVSSSYYYSDYTSPFFTLH